ncbi:unnamed protein product [Adineta ricciae]|uniref:Uncharacterized protein n=1 Tax=Adineta ricciae TaxID=249248 RepID=A0A815KXH1_ADIRI|nr:unnamed protein product [Adineta ricciae]
MSCYYLLPPCLDSLNKKQCLDWRDICDGEIDCLDGSDEQLKLGQQLCYQTLSMDCEPGYVDDEHLPCADLIRLYVRLRKEISDQQPFDIKHELPRKCKTTDKLIPIYKYSHFFSPFVNAYLTHESIQELIDTAIIDPITFLLSPDVFCVSNQTSQCSTKRDAFRHWSIPFDGLFGIKLKTNLCEEHPQNIY